MLAGIGISASVQAVIDDDRLAAKADRSGGAARSRAGIGQYLAAGDCEYLACRQVYIAVQRGDARTVEGGGIAGSRVGGFGDAREQTHTAAAEAERQAGFFGGDHLAGGVGGGNAADSDIPIGGSDAHPIATHDIAGEDIGIAHAGNVHRITGESGARNGLCVAG